MDSKLILVVDDTEATLILLHQVLVHLGHSVVLASSAAEAISQANRHRPDLILLDLEMEGEDPRDTLRGLATDGFAATTPVVGLSNVERPDAEMQVGISAILRKPVVLPALMRTLERALAPAIHGPEIREVELAEPPRS